MTDPFQAAWIILKNRGHALDLSHYDNEGNRLEFGEDGNVDRLMEERQQAVDRQGENLKQFNHFDNLDHEPVHDYYSAYDRFRHGKEAQDARERLMDRMVMNEGHQESYGRDIENQIRQDEQREGQQGEADEMEAMGVEPMSRTLGGKPPANIGQAGSTGGADPERYSINPFAMGEAMNTFRPPQELHAWASGVKPTASGSPKISDEQVERDIDTHHEGQPLQSNESFGNEQAGTLTDTPRHEKRGQEGAGRAFDKPKRPSWWRGE